MYIAFLEAGEYNPLWFLKNRRGDGESVEEEKKELPLFARDNSEKTGWSLRESHPWLVQGTAAEEDDVDEVLRYTLDEIRFA